MLWCGLLWQLSMNGISQRIFRVSDPIRGHADVYGINLFSVLWLCVLNPLILLFKVIVSTHNSETTTVHNYYISQQLLCTSLSRYTRVEPHIATQVTNILLLHVILYVWQYWQPWSMHYRLPLILALWNYTKPSYMDNWQYNLNCLY